MQVTWNGNIISINFADEGHDETLTLDLDGLTEAVQDAGKRFGFQTKLRNFRAQVATDTKEGKEACKRMKAGIALLDSGTWASEKTSAAKVDLTDDEKREIIEQEVVNAYKVTGQTPEAILKSFREANEDLRKVIVTNLAPQITKRIKETLKARKLASKIEMPKLA